MMIGDGSHAVEQARALLNTHPVLGPLALRVRVNQQPGNRCSADAWAAATPSGRIHVRPDHSGTVDQWVTVLAHVLLHLGLGHAQERDHPREWNAACDIVANCLLARLDLLPAGLLKGYRSWEALDEEALYRQFCAEGIPANFPVLGGQVAIDLLPEAASDGIPDWTYLLGRGLRAGALAALRLAGSRTGDRSHRHDSPAQRARSWFIREYPLLGALASAFTVVEDAELCRRAGIAIAAVRPALREIYINPSAGLDGEECRFVVAHELLHVGLLHHRRRGDRHPFLWNIACDYVINGWLLEMGVGVMPAFRGQHDLDLGGLSAEAVYARIVDNLQLLRACGTFRGLSVGDILVGDDDERSVSLDAFLRRCLTHGLLEHARQGRGTVPAGLTEDVRGRLRPPIPWNVQLGRWFDQHLAHPAFRRSYARPSRRQSATPEIPRPRVTPQESNPPTFGVVLDTSGSMERQLLADALGAIAGYALSRDVAALRLVFCDAEPYDCGYLQPERLLDWVDVRGRGGTVLQPALDLLEEARDFPPSCPILIVTDGLCDMLTTRREHAFLLPPHSTLPMCTPAPKFSMT